MKQITAQKWLSMDSKKQSWIVHRTHGGSAAVYWHCVNPEGEKLGGSMSKKSQCDSMIATAKGLTKKQAQQIPCEFPHPFARCVAKPSVAYPLYSHYEHVALGLIPELLAKFGKVEISSDGLEFTAISGGIAVKAWGIQSTLCLLFLALEGVIQTDGSAPFVIHQA